MMLLFTSLSLLFFSVFAEAGICQNSWKNENKKNKVLESCELVWSGGGIELVRLKKGCAFPGPKSEPCFILRSCGKDKEKGASVFRVSVAAESYCVSGTDLEAMGSSRTLGGKAHVLCSGGTKPESLRLAGPDGKLTKVCNFPFSQAL